MLYSWKRRCNKYCIFCIFCKHSFEFLFSCGIKWFPLIERSLFCACICADGLSVSSSKCLCLLHFLNLGFVREPHEFWSHLFCAVRTSEILFSLPTDFDVRISVNVNSIHFESSPIVCWFLTHKPTIKNHWKYLLLTFFYKSDCCKFLSKVILCSSNYCTNVFAYFP